VTAALVIAAILVLGTGLVWLARTMRAELARMHGETTATTAQIVGEVDRRLSGVDKRLEGLDGRLLATQRSSGQAETRIVEKLGKLDGTAAQMLARANDLAKLEQVLRPPKARGGFGELLLENLLRDRLPPSAYTMQYGFDSGERVDAVVRVGQLIPVDSKFPLDNFQRIVEAASDDERQLYEKAFARDVKSHIEAIATKYIRPAEGTYDFAFMYVPVESVYYELACGPTGALLQYAHERRVFPVSPTTFTAYLQVIVLGMRSMQIEEHAHEVMSYVAALGNDFERFRDEFELVGKHLGHAQASYGKADKKLDKLGSRLDEAIEDLEDEVVELDAPQLSFEPPAIEAA
jgi:DNA recombination protein RmuC